MSLRDKMNQFTKSAVGLMPGAKPGPPFGPNNWGLNNFPYSSQLGPNQPNPNTPQSPGPVPATTQGVQQSAQLAQQNNALASPQNLPGTQPDQSPGANLEQLKVLQASINPKLFSKIARSVGKFRVLSFAKDARMTLPILGTSPDASENVPGIAAVTEGTDPVGGKEVKEEVADS